LMELLVNIILQKTGKDSAQICLTVLVMLQTRTQLNTCNEDGEFLTVTADAVDKIICNLKKGCRSR
jgi:hypothetical protein